MRTRPSTENLGLPLLFKHGPVSNSHLVLSHADFIGGKIYSLLAREDDLLQLHHTACKSLCSSSVLAAHLKSPREDAYFKNKEVHFLLSNDLIQITGVDPGIEKHV